LLEHAAPDPSPHEALETVKADGLSPGPRRQLPAPELTRPPAGQAPSASPFNAAAVPKVERLLIFDEVHSCTDPRSARRIMDAILRAAWTGSTDLVRLGDDDRTGQEPA
jgi:hypothetical protein